MMQTISTSALIRRINRKLAHREQILCVSRGEREKQNVGDYHVIDHSNTVVMTFINLEPYARDLGVMGEWETLEEAE